MVGKETFLEIQNGKCLFLSVDENHPKIKRAEV